MLPARSAFVRPSSDEAGKRGTSTPRRAHFPARALGTLHCREVGDRDRRRSIRRRVEPRDATLEQSRGGRRVGRQPGDARARDPRAHRSRVHAVLREPSQPRETSRWRARPRRRPRVLAEGIDPRGEAERVSGTRVRVRAARDLAQTQTTSKRASNRRRIFFSRAARFPPSFPRRRSSRRRRANSTRRRRETSSWGSTSRRSRPAKTS